MKPSKRKLGDRELGILARMGATPTLNSGATFGDMDGFIRKFRFTKYSYSGIGVEIKSTEKKSFSIKILDLLKAYKQARDYGRMPVFVTDFAKTDAVVTLRLDDFMAILSENDDLTNELLAKAKDREFRPND